MSPRAWFYLRTGKKKHLIILADKNLPGEPMESAVCGCQVLAALPPRAKWHSDPEGLAEREPCKQCTAILERETHV